MTITMNGPNLADAAFEGGEPLHPIVVRTVEWRHVDSSMPDDDISVLVATTPHAQETWEYPDVIEAYHDGDCWIECATGATLLDGAVSHWAHLPQGPAD